MLIKELGIIGIGNMGTALLKGIVKSKLLSEKSIVIYDIDQTLLSARIQEFKVEASKNNSELVSTAKYVLLAVKPQIIESVLKEIGPLINEEQVIISIAAGITLSYIEQFVKKQVGLVRVMPNTPALIGAGASAIAHNGNVKKNDLERINSIFNAVGIVVNLEEKYMDAVTGLSGSGPAYVFIIIEALSDAGVKMGLPRNIALKLAAQTVLGAAKMVLETQKHPGELKDMVTSPGGTTITALHEIEKGKLRATLINAVEAATLKSKSLK